MAQFPSQSTAVPRARRARIAHRTAGPAVRSGSINWERAGRAGLVVMLLVIGYLYVAPTRTYIAQRHEATAQRAQLQRLGREHRALKLRALALTRDSTIELEARKLGMTRPDERPYVIDTTP